MNHSEYVSPLVRKTVVQCPVVSGYVTARLYSQDDIPPTLSGGATNTNMLVTFENVGNTHISVLLRETADRSVSGTRTNLTSAAWLRPGGQTTQLVSNLQSYLEIYCTGTTTGNLRTQIDAQRRWTECGFDRTDPYYPTSLWQAKVLPTAITP